MVPTQAAEQVETAQAEKKEKQPPVAGAGIGLIQFYFSFNKYR